MDSAFGALAADREQKRGGNKSQIKNTPFFKSKVKKKFMGSKNLGPFAHVALLGVGRALSCRTSVLGDVRRTKRLPFICPMRTVPAAL
jgi:hypothetical protein